MDCRGPCLPHCYRSHPATVWLARASLVYVVACLWYLLATRHLGTPFTDSLSPPQRTLKATSARLRGRAFTHGLLVGTLLVALVRPLRPVG